MVSKLFSIFRGNRQKEDVSFFGLFLGLPDSFLIYIFCNRLLGDRGILFSFSHHIVTIVTKLPFERAITLLRKKKENRFFMLWAVFLHVASSLQKF